MRLLLSYYKDTIEQYAKMITMPYRDITYAHNKKAMWDYAKRADVTMPPHTVAPDSLQNAFEILKTLDSPVVIKPRIGCNAHGQKKSCAIPNSQPANTSKSSRNTDWKSSSRLFNSILKAT